METGGNYPQQQLQPFANSEQSPYMSINPSNKSQVKEMQDLEKKEIEKKVMIQESMPFNSFKKEMNEGSSYNSVFLGAENVPYRVIFDSLSWVFFNLLSYLVGWVLAIFWGVIFGAFKFALVWVIFPFLTIYRWVISAVSATIKPLFEAIGTRRHIFEGVTPFKGKECIV